MEKSLAEREKDETIFFSTGIYRELDRDIVGVGSLRVRLSSLLFRHLTGEIPNLQAELNAKYSETKNELDKLGQARSTARQQKKYLMDVGTKFERIAEAAVDGYVRCWNLVCLARTNIR